MTRLHRFAAAACALDRLQQHTDAGEAFWIYSEEQCIVDTMRRRRIAGRDVVLSALQRPYSALLRHLAYQRAPRELWADISGELTTWDAHATRWRRD